MMIFFSHLSLFNGWNILKIWENLSKWNMDVGPSHLRASYVLTTYIYAHHVSYVRAPYASNVGDVPEYVCPVHICEAMRWLSHTWSGWDVFLEVHRITWLFSKKVWESNNISIYCDLVHVRLWPGIITNCIDIKVIWLFHLWKEGMEVGQHTIIWHI